VLPVGNIGSCRLSLPALGFTSARRSPVQYLPALLMPAAARCHIVAPPS
jgi:hypothetical protein